MSQNPYRMQLAIHDFQAARQKAGLQEIISRLAGRSNRLLSYEEVAGKLRLHVRTERGNQSIPLAAIAGSVGRATEFTRTFLPLRNDDRERWARVKSAMDGGENLPPIEVYKVGEVYFVIDGNHRVSIARQEKLDYLDAHVIEVQTKIPLTADMRPEEVDKQIIRVEQEEFLAETGLGELRPNVDLGVTVCYQYEKILDQIRLRSDQLQQGRKDKVPFKDAVLEWYDHDYIPLVEAIRDRDLMRWFPSRTVTDFYLWICEYHKELEQEMGWTLTPETVAAALSARESEAAQKQRLSTGGWRKSRLTGRYLDRLFNDILVPLSGDAESWQSLDQAILVARREGANLNGLHVVGSEQDLTSDHALSVQKKFGDLCALAGVKGRLVLEVGDIVRKISERSRLADLTVLKIVNAPLGGLTSLKSPFRGVINGACGPVLGLRGSSSSLDRALVAFDGSPRAQEALFIGAYLAEKWKTSLTVFTALENGRLPASLQEQARRYLEFHEVEANYVLEKESSQAMRDLISSEGLNLVLLGSYGSSVLREVFIGNTLDFALRELQIPILICR